MKFCGKWLLGPALLASLTAAFWNQPIYRKYTIDSRGQLNGLRILLLTDLHNTAYGKASKKLINMIDRAKPDLLFFGGDIVDEKSSSAPVKTLLEGLESRYPMYYITGNHEYWTYKADQIHQMFRDHGVEVLINETTQIQTAYGHISLVGLDDPDHCLGRSDREAISAFIEKTYNPDIMKGYRILLSHRPEHTGIYMKYDFDLILSGHAHGGQMRIPFLLNGLYAPNQGFFPPFAGGRYRLQDRTDFIVSRGLSFRKKLPRVMNPPELVLIDFR